MLSGVSGGLLALAFGGGAPVIGSSGAVFGLLGSFMAYGRKRKDFLGFIIWKKFSFLAIVMIVIGFLLPNVSNSGHIGGIVGGYLFTWFVTPDNKNRILKILPYLFYALAMWGLFQILQKISL